MKECPLFASEVGLPEQPIFAKSVDARLNENLYAVAIVREFFARWVIDLRYFGHFLIFCGLTALTQIGGVMWLQSRLFQRKFLAFILLYTAASVSAIYVAPLIGRTALSCRSDGTLAVRSWFYCATNRTYVTTELRDVLQDLANGVDERFPNAQTVVLDGNFPFLDGFPLLPHLSHDDGQKVDIGFYYRDDNKYLRGQTRSPIGYFAFEAGVEACPPRWLTLRWDLTWLQPLWRPLELDEDRTKFALLWLAQDPRVGKVFVEPHLKDRLEAFGGKIRFQGCRAARHDDHIHIQL
jgi:hypothetical protein